jgi:hypothetical protein
MHAMLLHIAQSFACLKGGYAEGGVRPESTNQMSQQINLGRPRLPTRGSALVVLDEHQFIQRQCLSRSLAFANVSQLIVV